MPVVTACLPLTISVREHANAHSLHGVGGRLACGAGLRSESAAPSWISVKSPRGQSRAASKNASAGYDQARQDHL